MAELKIDTVKVREQGADIMNLAVELKSTLDVLFERIGNITNVDDPTKIDNNVWVGETASKYVDIVMNKKDDYYTFQNILYSYGKFLSDSADEYEKKLESSRY